MTGDIHMDFICKGKLPLVISPKNSNNVNVLVELLRENHPWLVEQLLKYGAILFRNYNVIEPSDLSEVVKACGLGKFMSYEGGTGPRTQLAEGVYTSTDLPSYRIIPLHNEMSYIKNAPNHLYFSCQIPTDQYGATPLVDCRVLYQSLDASLRLRLEQKGIMYRRYLYEHNWLQKQISKIDNLVRPWPVIFGTEDQNIVEELLKKQDVDFEWLPNRRGLKTQQKAPAFRPHPVTGEVVWFNHLLSYNHHDGLSDGRSLGPRFSWLLRYLYTINTMPILSTYGDGALFSKEDISEVVKLFADHIIRFPWERGDFLLMDNYLTCHGREAFKGRRKILASMTF